MTSTGNKPKTIMIDDVEYVRAKDMPPEGNRNIVVLDRGWIFVGYLSTKDGVSTLTDCHNVRNWKGGGYGGLTDGTATAQLDSCAPITFKAGSEIFMTPVEEGWRR